MWHFLLAAPLLFGAIKAGHFVYFRLFGRPFVVSRKVAMLRGMLEAPWLSSVGIPVGEELVFRTLLLTPLLERGVWVWVMVVVQAVLFASMHTQYVVRFRVWMTVEAVVMGAVFVFIARQSHWVLASIVMILAHMLQNGVATGLLWYLRKKRRKARA